MIIKLKNGKSLKIDIHVKEMDAIGSLIKEVSSPASADYFSPNILFLVKLIDDIDFSLTDVESVSSD